MLPDNLASLRVVDLKAELVKRKLSTKGKKDELVARLQQWIDEEKENSVENQDTDQATESAPAPEQTTSAADEHQEKEEEETIVTKPVEAPALKTVEEPVKEPVIAAAVAAAVAAPAAVAVVPVPSTTEKEPAAPAAAAAAAAEPKLKPDAAVHIPTSSAPEPVKTHNPAETLGTSETTEAVKQSPTEESGKGSQGDRGEKRKRQEEKRVEEKGHEKRNKTVPANTTATVEIKDAAIYIKGFVRPLIIRNVQELIKQFGEVKRFWMDSIKTHCYVIYAETAQAIAAHKGIHGIVFPKDTGRKLTVGGLTPEQAEILIEQEQNAADRRIKLDWEALITSACNGELSKETDGAANVQEGRRPRPQGISQITRELQKAMTASSAMGTDSAHAAPTGAAAEEDRPMHETAIATASPVAEMHAPPPAPASTLSLDELFRKTTTLPHLYYLPVSEQAASQNLDKVQQDSSA